MWNATTRLLIRDFLAGLGAFLASYQAGSEWLPALVAGAALFVTLAAAEFGTPLNPSVGYAGKPDAPDAGVGK